MNAALFYSFAIEPSSPAAGELVRIRIDSPSGCFDGYLLVSVDQPNHLVYARFYGSGVVLPECPAPTPQYFQIGQLPRGDYSVQFQHCSDAVGPGPASCETFETRQLVVGGGEPVEVPAFSAGGAVMLVALLLFAATRRICRLVHQ